ncbi:MAG: FMN-binding protein [Minisyncoccia bacterium]
MKKILLSIFVIITFVAYSWQQRHEGTGAVIAPKPSSGSSSPNSGAQASTNNSSQSTSLPSASSSSSATYKDGKYTGNAADAYYGYIQVEAIINGGKITDVQFLQYPNDRQNSIFINQQAMPYLKQEAIKAQSAKVDIIGGATDTSYAFIQSLTNALNQALL